MKTSFIPFCILTVGFLIIYTSTFAQVPQKFNYQGIARDLDGIPLAKQKMTIKLSVLPTSDATIAEYEETQSVITNEFGLYTIQIGNGTSVTGEMKLVKWETGNKYIRVAIDPKGGNDFVVAGTSQLLSVPYAIYADKARTLTNIAHGDTRTGAVNSNAAHVVGDVNYITKFTSFNTIGKSLLYDNGSAIGIGTTSPAATAKLHIYDATTGNTELRVQHTNATAGASRISFFNDANTTFSATANYAVMNKQAAGNTGIVGPGFRNSKLFGFNNSQGSLLFSTGGNIGFGYYNQSNSTVTTRLFIDSTTGYIGAGTTTPGARLEINGQIKITGGIPGAGKVLMSDASGLANWATIANGGLQGPVGPTGPTGATGPAGVGMPSGSNVGDMLYWTGSTWQNIPTGNTGQILTLGSNGLPIWQTNAIQNNLVQLTTSSATNISYYNVDVVGTIVNNTNNSITVSGIVWSTTPNPTIASPTKTINGSTVGSFTSTLTGLLPNTTYYACAYATNNAGTSYGNAVSFITLANSLPTLTTVAVTNIGYGTAISGGNITNDGGLAITARGVCWSTTPNPSISNSNTVDGTGSGIFTSNINLLNPNITYYIKAYATNNVGTSYGNQLTFNFSAILPTITTINISNILNSSAMSGGNLINDGGAFISSFGVCWNTSPNPTLSNSFTVDGGLYSSLSGSLNFSSSISNLLPNTTYYLKSYATNSVGTVYGNELNFTTSNIIGVGYFYQGGIIAYILQIGDSGYVSGQVHGIIAAPTDYISSAEWGCSINTIVGALGTSIGTGNQNTIDIINSCSQSGIAARICYDLVLNGYNDWYLPSKDELNQLYLNSNAIGGFNGSYSYWSSSNDNINGIYAWSQVFFNGTQNISLGSDLKRVRAIRAF